MEANKEKNNLNGLEVTCSPGEHMYKFLPGDTLNLKVKFPHFTILKVIIMEYDINKQFEIVPRHG